MHFIFYELNIPIIIKLTITRKNNQRCNGLKKFSEMLNIPFVILNEFNPSISVK